MKKTLPQQNVVTKKKLTTKISTTFSSKKLNCVVKKCVYKKVWMRIMKADRNTTPQYTYKRWMTHTIILNRVVIYY